MKKIITMLIVLAMLMLAVGTTAALAAPADATDTNTVPAPLADSTDAPRVTDEGESITQAVNNVVSAAVKLVFAAVTLLLTKYAIPFAQKTVVPFIRTTLVPLIRDTIIPWLEEHRLRSLVDSLVHGAEQLANSGQLPKEKKKQYVVDALTALGIEVTPEVDAIIEGAVLDLDKTVKELLQAVIDEIKGKDGPESGQSEPLGEPEPVPVPAADTDGASVTECGAEATPR